MAETWIQWFRRRAAEAAADAVSTTANTILPGSGQVVRPIVRHNKPLRQVPAGALETTIANSSLNKGSYRPAIVDQVPALVGLVATLAGRSPGPGSFLERELRRVQAASERTNKFLNINSPANTGETAMRVLGSLVVPMPKGGQAIQAALASRAAPVVRAATKIPKPLRTTAKVAAEIALPLRQTGPKGTAIAAGVGTALGDTISTIVDPNYQGIASDSIREALKPDAVIELDDFDKEVLEGVGSTTPTETGAQDELDAFVLGQELAPEEQDAVEEEQKQFNWQEAALVLGAIGIGGAAARMAPQLLRNNAKAAVEGELPSFTGKVFRPSKGSFTQRMRTALFDQALPLRNAAEEFLSPARARELSAKADLVNNVSIGSRAAHFFRTGRMPQVNQRSERLAPLAESYAKELSLDEQREVSDALLAQSALDDIQRTGTQSALNFDKAGNPVTPVTLRAMVSAARSNPKYVKYMDAVTRSYQDLLKFRVARGTLTPQMAQQLATERPNYVRFKRDLETEVPPEEGQPFNANKDRGAGYSRGEDDASGIQGTTGIGNPFNNLFDDWADHIRRAEVNDLRAQWLEEMDAIGATHGSRRIVQRIPNGVTPNTSEGVHTVFVSGEKISYKVNDDVMSKALEFAPRQTIRGLEVYRQIRQNMVTGPLGTLTNLFSFVKSPVYDTTMGLLLKPKDTQVGLVNEALSHLGVRPGMLGSLDPTQYVAAYTGMARYAWDDLRGSMAQNLSEQLLREHSWLRSVLGDTKVTALRDSLEAAYENSNKAWMDIHGVTSHTLHGSPDPSKVMDGLGLLTPAFSNDMAAQLARDTRAAWAQGNVGPMKALLESSKSGIARVRANTIANLYGHLLEAAHNGFRYSVVAANRKTKMATDLAAVARKISVDSAQHGNNPLVNKALGGLMYGNLTMQSLHAIATNPTTVLRNLGFVVGPLLAMHYVGLATDPGAQEAHRLKTAQQKATSLTTFGGAEIPVDPIMRLALAPLTTIMDHVTGAHDGNWNGDVMQAFSTWLESDYDEEAYKQDLTDTLWADLKANSPVTPEAMPGVTEAMAYFGIDPGMSRTTGEASPVLEQRITGFDMDQKRPNSLTSAWLENMITAVTGSVGQHTMNMANDAYRSYYATDDVQKAFESALGRYKDQAYRSGGVARPLFGQYEQSYSTTDTNWQLVQARQKGIELAQAIHDRDLITGGAVTNQNIRTGMAMTDDPSQRETVIGTQNQLIAGIAGEMRQDRQLRDIVARLSGLGKQVEGIRAGYVTSPEQKNMQINELNEQRRYLTGLQLQIIRQYEKVVQDRIGDPDFRFDTYDPEEYKKPWQLPPQTLQ